MFKKNTKLCSRCGNGHRKRRHINWVVCIKWKLRGTVVSAILYLTAFYLIYRYRIDLLQVFQIADVNNNK